jgi:hypothetical protein
MERYACRGTTCPKEVVMPFDSRRGPSRARRRSVGQTDRPSCAECSSEATQRVEIDVLGATLEKDLCGRHLNELLKSARRIP